MFLIIFFLLFRFVTGNPRNNLHLDGTFLTVERYIGQRRSGDWDIVYTDKDWETE